MCSEVCLPVFVHIELKYGKLKWPFFKHLLHFFFFFLNCRNSNCRDAAAKRLRSLYPHQTLAVAPSVLPMQGRLFTYPRVLRDPGDGVSSVALPRQQQE